MLPCRLSSCPEAAATAVGCSAEVAHSAVIAPVPEPFVAVAEKRKCMLIENNILITNREIKY